MKRILWAVLALCALASPIFAQSNTGRLVGTVSDPSGIIPGATVVVKDNKTGKERTAVATDEGTFTVPQLEVGSYNVTITVAGHKTFTVTDIKIDVGKDYSLNATLEVGNITENVTVVGGADVINATDGQLSNTVSQRQILELPLNGRNPLSLITLQPGVASNGATDASLNGQRSAATSITRDGININDNYIRANASDFAPERPSVDDTEQFTITTQNAGAEKGYGASQVEVVTPRGQNEFHGAIWEYNRNSKFSANTFFNNASGNFAANDPQVLSGAQKAGAEKNPRTFLNRNQYGAKASGPVWKNKVFFFGYVEFLRTRQARAKTATILLPNARQGIFTYVDSSGTTRTVNLFTLAPAVAGGITGINPTIQSRILANMPTAGNITTVGDQLNTTGYLFNQVNNRDRNGYSMRFDYDMSARNTFNFAWSHKKDTNLRADTEGSTTAAANGSGGYATVPAITQISDNRFMATSWRFTPTANLTNELRGGFLRSDVPFNRTLAEPDFFINVGTFVTNPETNFQTQGRSSNTYNIQDNAEYIWGNHSFRFGAQGQFFRIVSFGPSSYANSTIPTYAIGTSSNSPQLTATNFPGGISSTQLTNANALFALLGGIIGSDRQTFNANSTTSGFLPNQQFVQGFDFENYSAYFADQWRFTPHLSLNLGVRYELYTAVREPNGFALEPVIPAGTDPATALLDPNGTVNFIGNNGGNNQFFKSDKNNFAPVVSFAWSPQFKNKLLNSVFPGEGRTVIRGGFRMSYINDEFVRVAENANTGNAGLQSEVINSSLNGRINAPPTITAPAFQIPRNFAAGNAQASNFGTVFAIDPNLQAGRTNELNFGIQRELGFQTALEVRFVSGWSNNLIRGLDINELDIINNGFLAEFLRARNNLLNAGGIFCAAGTPNCQPLTIFGTAPGSTIRVSSASPLPAGTISQTTLTNNLNAGTPADLALSIIQNGARGSFRFRPNENAGAIDLMGNSGKYRYNGLQIELRRRFSQGLYFQANYTFQKTLTNASGVGQTKFEPNLSNRFPDLEYARADYDQTHVFNFNGIYELPFGRGKRYFSDAGSLLDRIIGGWQFTSIVQITTGAPLTLTDVRGSLNRNGRATRQTPVTNLTKGQVKDLFGIYRTPCGVYFINPVVLNINQNSLAAGICSGAAFGTGRGSEGFGTTPFTNQVFFNAGPGQTGNLERAFINGPMYLNWDASLIKNIRISERVRFQLRAEVFNVLNRSNFFLGNTSSINSASFGKITSTFDPRIIQFAGRVEF
jgi:hypothetical protein